MPTVNCISNLDFFQAPSFFAKFQQSAARATDSVSIDENAVLNAQRAAGVNVLEYTIVSGCGVVAGDCHMPQCGAADIDSRGKDSTGWQQEQDQRGD